jgi:rRNA maturation RNase YbeY
VKVIVNQLHSAGGPLTRALRRRLTAAARLLPDEHRFAGGELAVILADDHYLQKLNRSYRGLDAPTDVLSFSMLEEGDFPGSAAAEDRPVLIGDIYISLDRAHEQAAAAGRSLEQEVLALSIHGLLHLYGFDHSCAATAERMEQKEADLLNRVQRISPEEKVMERLIGSFQDAFNGLHYTLTTQRNMAIHFAAASLVIIFSFLLRLEPWEFFLILTVIFAVLIAEMINTAIEKTVDLVTQEQRKLARIAKDVAAGAVLLTAFYAVLAGGYIFGPRLWKVILKLIHF